MANKYKYIIRVNYDTGDSFTNTPDQNIYLDYDWYDIKIADENLERIKAHNNFIEDLETYKRAKPKFDIISKYNREPWFSEIYSEFSLKLLDNKGEPFLYSCGSWCGYFEIFNNATIEIEKI